MLHGDNVHVCFAAEFDLEFDPVEYMVSESAGLVTVCVIQTSFPTVFFERDVTVYFTTSNGTATCE